MATARAEASAVIPAAPQQIWAILTDYRVRHPAILPKPYFESLKVEEGGQGAGTVFVASMNVFGTKSTLRMRVSEPDPGRVLAETDESTGLRTTFTIDPLNGGAQSRVTIATDAPVKPGIGGWIESKLVPLIMRRIYNAELKLLAEAAGP